MIDIMSMTVFIRFAPLLAVLLVAAFIDIRYRRIPNWLTFGLIAGGLVRAFCLGGIGGAGHSLLGLLTGGSLAVLLFAISALGGGDVKLLAGIGAWVGPGPVLAIFLVEAIVGMVIVLVQAAAQGRMRTLFRNTAVITANFAFASEVGLDNAVESGLACKSVARPLPYAVPVFVATFLVLSMGRMFGS
jgi:prepilin peptidase CpaA